MDFQFDSLNSVTNYNKIFQQNLNNTNNKVGIGAPDDFEAVFNRAQERMVNGNQNQQLSGSVEMFMGGADAINAQKIENLSDTARMAKEFSNSFSNGISSLSQTQKNAEDAVETFASGGDISVHDVMIATQKSSLSMQMALQIRNQMVNAYNEFKNIRI